MIRRAAHDAVRGRRTASPPAGPAVPIGGRPFPEVLGRLHEPGQGRGPDPGGPGEEGGGRGASGRTWSPAPRRAAGPRPGSIARAFETLAELQRQGLVRHLGVSNATAEQVAEARSIGPIVAVRNQAGRSGAAARVRRLRAEPPAGSAPSAGGAVSASPSADGPGLSADPGSLTRPGGTGFGCKEG